FNPTERLITMRGLLFREFMAFAEERFGTEVASRLTPGEPQPAWNPVAAYSHPGLLDPAEHLRKLRGRRSAALPRPPASAPRPAAPPGSRWSTARRDGWAISPRASCAAARTTSASGSRADPRAAENPAA